MKKGEKRVMSERDAMKATDNSGVRYKQNDGANRSGARRREGLAKETDAFEARRKSAENLKKRSRHETFRQ